MPIGSIDSGFGYVSAPPRGEGGHDFTKPEAGASNSDGFDAHQLAQQSRGGVDSVYSPKGSVDAQQTPPSLHLLA